MRQSQVKKTRPRPRRASSGSESTGARRHLVPRIHQAIAKIECVLNERPSAA